MYKFLCSIIVITSLSLTYIYQQVQLVEYSYRINNSHKRLCLLIDQNEGLRYNVASLKSPDNLTRRLASNNIKLDTPQNWYNIRLAKAEPTKGKSEIARRNGALKIASKVITNILTPKTEAVAQELN